MLFEAPRENTSILSQIIMQKLSQKFERKIMVIVRSIGDLKELDVRQPFKDNTITPGTRSFVTFIAENTKHRNIPVSPTHEGYRILSNSDGMICSVLFEQPGVGAVELMSAIEKQYGKNVTTRSWNTISRILKMGK